MAAFERITTVRSFPNNCCSVHLCAQRRSVDVCGSGKQASLDWNTYSLLTYLAMNQRFARMLACPTVLNKTKNEI